TANVLKNVLGIYPAGWRVPVEFVRDGQVFEANVRLASLHGEGELEALIEQEAQNPPDIQPPAPPEEKGEEDQGENEGTDKPKLPRIRLPDALGGAVEPKLPPEIEKLYE